jgi:putative endonuclease
MTTTTASAPTVPAAKPATAATAPKPETRKANPKKLHALAVDAASRFMDKRGYCDIDLDFKGADIVARDPESNALVFVDVKARSDASRGFPNYDITDTKRAKMERVALAYVSAHDLGETMVRFDVISVVVCAPNRAMIKHHINAFALD